ncbi:MAG: acyl-CoA dehydratase activase [Peptococcaceae bacterium]|jgi:predicted CoA-substrate-specific enzyme activase|nr:acyl-CoA dehydratase activase [Peptococcaceae bacterium]
MITAGIDVGLENIKAVILKDNKIVARGKGLSGGADRPGAIEAVWSQTLKEAGISASDVTKVVATGKGKFDVSFAAGKITEPVAASKAAALLCPKATTVVDAGADETLVVTLKDGGIQEMLINQKCSAGLGLFLESMAGRLGLSIEELGGLDVPYQAEVNDGCVVMAELDALSLLNHGTSPKEVAMAVVDAVAVRAYSVIVDIYRPAVECVLLCGGMAKNNAFVKALRKLSKLDYMIPDEAEYAGALGAAAYAAAS